MRKTLYVGDIHADFEVLEAFAMHMLGIFPDITRVIQVGDFGFWPDFGIDYWYRKCQLPVPVFFIDGNHEDHIALRHRSTSVPAKKSGLFDAFHIPRGYCEDGILFMGGADSPDKEYRQAGITWFVEENIHGRDVDFATQNIRVHGRPIRVMVAHDTTEGAFPLVKRQHWQMGDWNRIALERLFAIAKPILYVHGHLHFHSEYTYQGCRFICLRNADHFHMQLKYAPSDEDITLAARECCLVADEEGNVYEF